MFRLPVLVLSVLPALTGAVHARAQGILPLSGTWRVGTLGAQFGDACAPGAPGAFVEGATAVFRANGSFALFAQSQVLCPGNALVTGELVTGFYAVREDGLLFLASGQDVDRLFLRADGSVAVSTRHVGDVEDAPLAIAVQLSSGKSNASLNGPYHIVRLTLQNAATGLTSASELGTITFDAMGSYTEVVQRHTVSPTGVTQTTNPPAFMGAYSVAADGSLSIGAALNGALSPDDEVFFWTETQGPVGGLSGPVASLTVGIRQGQALPPSVLGPFGIAELDVEYTSPGPNPDTLHTAVGELTLALSRNLAVDVFEVDTTRVATSSSTSRAGGTYTLSPTGDLSLQISGGGPPFPARLGSAEDLVIGRPLDAGVAGMLLGVRRCLTTFGVGTQGSAGIEPRLGSSSGFPRVGNTGFAIELADGRGGTAGLLGVSLNQGNGQPFMGGQLWVGLAGLTTLPVTLSGPAGVPGLGRSSTAFPVPNVPGLVGTSVYCQGFLVDTGAASGVALSPGLWLTICR